MRSLILVTASLLLGMISIHGDAVPTSDHDALCHDQAIKLEISRAQPSKAVKAMGKLREFLWQHWSREKRGAICAVFYPGDSPPSTVSYSVEPDNKGVWTIVRTLRRKSHGTNLDETYRSVAYHVRRIEIATDGFSERVEIATIAKPPRELYRLSLRERGGNVLEEL